jgi:type I restriction enzyme S subunit
MMDVGNWQLKRLEEIADIYSGSTPSTTKSSFWNGDIIWVTPNDLSQLNTPYLKTSGKKITLEGLKSCSAHILPSGSIILSSRAPIGYIAISTVEFCTNQGCKSFNIKEEYNSEFVYYNLNFNVNKIKTIGEGTTFAEISKTALGKVEILFLENKEEQEKIAEVLSTIDRAIAQTEAIIAKQQRIKTGLMQDLLTKGIDEYGNIRSEATHEFRDSAIGRIPVEWEVISLGEIVRNHGGKLQTGPFGSQLHSYEYVDNGIPVVMPQDINNSGISTSEIVHITESKAEDLGRHRMIAGDLVFARRGDLSRCTVIQPHQKGWICGTGCLLLRVPSGVLLSQWACEMYRYHIVQVQVGVQAVGSTMVNLNTGILANLLIPLPKYEEQRQIANRFQSLEKDYTNLLARKQKLNVVKTGLMQDLLTGKVRVTNLLKEKEPTSP